MFYFVLSCETRVLLCSTGWSETHYVDLILSLNLGPPSCLCFLRAELETPLKFPYRGIVWPTGM